LSLGSAEEDFVFRGWWSWFREWLSSQDGNLCQFFLCMCWKRWQHRSYWGDSWSSA